MKFLDGNDLGLDRAEHFGYATLENDERHATTSPIAYLESDQTSKSQVQLMDEQRREKMRRFGLDLFRGLIFGTFVSGCALLPTRHLEGAPGWLHLVAQVLVGSDWVEQAGLQQYALMVVGCVLGWVYRLSSFRDFLMQAGAMLLGAQSAAVFWAEIAGLTLFMDVIDFPALYALSIVIGISAAWGILCLSFREVATWFRSLQVDWGAVRRLQPRHIRIGFLWLSLFSVLGGWGAVGLQGLAISDKYSIQHESLIVLAFRDYVRRPLSSTDLKRQLSALDIPFVQEKNGLYAVIQLRSSLRRRTDGYSCRFEFMGDRVKSASCDAWVRADKGR